ncbi:hypothetical protein MM1S1540310_4002 [Mycobacteroides abscessus subsp. bolletii 1S-154-0310]|nr:hypothetical protein MM1S1510930_4446 [Mycobacteroides abscessus subsp. bolletii 1S-151-0930]EIU69091.1 hypothetical protein MM1S1520914_4654 [Mycobacteroides abscessus subsp. bolletii 1S-152-0914]EIU71198.1 hypothetical protein MM1S1530915_3998 [Mycobacteroides abscessus subsp. bolletii 1S-153-0915]EIU79471.1 hypothetical protein MM1S1540310_4002 [Mycobacteroides abscessus subsp. bolletii 1S-154-0310]MBE5480736.1 hypothetical protein [Mycobacteroides abscessus]SHQ94022.1 Uncharacterised pr
MRLNVNESKQPTHVCVCGSPLAELSAGLEANLLHDFLFDTQ